MPILIEPAIYGHLDYDCLPMKVYDEYEDDDIPEEITIERDRYEIYTCDDFDEYMDCNIWTNLQHDVNNKNLSVDEFIDKYEKEITFLADKLGFHLEEEDWVRPYTKYQYDILNNAGNVINRLYAEL